MEYLSFLYYQENHTSVSCLYLYGFRFRVIIQNIFMHRLSFLSQIPNFIDLPILEEGREWDICCKLYD